MITRRQFLKAGGLVCLLPFPVALTRAAPTGVLVNDIHSQLNATRVHRVVTPQSLDEVMAAVHAARREDRALSIAGGRHAMGAQAFATDGVLIDIRKLDRVLRFDPEHRTIEVESGIQWPALADYLATVQEGRAQPWGFAQKQTGADRLTIGGALAANVHGRGLTMKPFIGDVESFTLVNAAGEVLRCSRSENAELFRLAIGGYGLFGVIYSVTLRLVPRRKIERVVQIIDVEELMPALRGRIAAGFLYGDFQYSIDTGSDEFMRRGVFSCYKPVASSIPIPPGQKKLSEAQWSELIYLTHADKAAAFRRYADYYLSTSGQVYWSDTHQMSSYTDDYHLALDRRLGAAHKATELITEIYVEREALPAFMREVGEDFRKNDVNVIYGTVRLIERDDESFLAWATKPYACIIFNLHVVHTPEGLRHAAAAFRRLIDHGIRHGGSYYLTYHKYATREQVLHCYPQFPEFLRLKRRYDAKEVFQSDWYRHYKKMLADA